MFDSNNYNKDVNLVPTEWLIETYLNIPYKLVGQNITIKSIFNDKDTNPSLVLYYYPQVKGYIYKCFSTNKSGSIIDLLCHKWGMDFRDAAAKIINDYFVVGIGDTTPREEIDPHKWKIKDFELRKWNTLDAKYWSAYNIGSKLLGQFNVKAIKHFSMIYVDKNDNVKKDIQIGPANLIFGYFKNNGEIYKIYRPKHKRKFTTIDSSYYHGMEQLKQYPDLIISSSMKDLLAIKSLGIQADIIAPHSENTLLPLKVIEKFKERYNIITLLDNDTAGINAMKKYKEQYKLGICYVPIENDVADLVKNKGCREAKIIITPLIDRAIVNYKKLNNIDNEEI